MNKYDILNKLFLCSSIYNNDLDNNNVLFVFGKTNMVHTFEAVFFGQNFLHLTGVEPADNLFPSSYEFYRACVNKKLTIYDFNVPKKDLCEKKLEILPQLIKIHKTAKIVGEYNFTKTRLYTEKLAGSVTACMGFVREDKCFVPNTVLKEDIRDITNKPQQKMLAIFRKNINDVKYTELTYIAKGIYVDELLYDKSLSDLIDVNNLNAAFPILHKSEAISTNNDNKTSKFIEEIEQQSDSFELKF